MHGHIADEH